MSNLTEYDAMMRRKGDFGPKKQLKQLENDYKYLPVWLVTQKRNYLKDRKNLRIKIRKLKRKLESK